MFKKNISVSSTHQLSGKDGKELRKAVLKVRRCAARLCSVCSSPRLGDHPVAAEGAGPVLVLTIFAATTA